MMSKRRIFDLVLLLVCFNFSNSAADVLVNYDTIHHPVLANGGMVVSQSEIASRVGSSILSKGGNAADANVAVGFALAVTLPRAGNIGGSGFSLVHTALTHKTTAYDFRSAGPINFNRQDFTDDTGNIDTDKLRFGPHAAGVPGTVAGLHKIWEAHGSLSWGELLDPAITLAEDGIEITGDLAYAIGEGAEVFRLFPSSRAVYLPADHLPTAGSNWRQPDLAWSLREIQKHGAEAFYTGRIAEKLVAAMQSDGGLISHKDLENYDVKERRIISTSYRGYTVMTMPPASSGGVTLLQMLNVLGHFDLKRLHQGSAASVHIMAEVMKRSAANRRQHIGDPDFVDVPLDQYLDKSMAKKSATGITVGKATHVDDIRPVDLGPPERFQSRDTTHYSIVDQWGNAVSTSYTLGYSFGSGYVVPNTGILLDNQIRNFYLNSPGHANRFEPGKRMISTMTPTMVFDRDGNLVLVTGTPGGGRIINVVLQIIVNMIDYGMNVAAATQAPRFNQSWRTNALALESGINNDTARILQSWGHEISRNRTMGSTQSIAIHDGYFAGAADTRRPGALAIGPQL